MFIGTSIQINEKKATINDQSALLSVKATKQEELKSVLEGEFDNEYVEKVARSLGFVNSDEKVYEYIDD
ncbi:MAG: septum formation initiator family protein [Clostridia bacterium]|nr:septum formation initiator family protein [Clostridia bacterium]